MCLPRRGRGNAARPPSFAPPGRAFSRRADHGLRCGRRCRPPLHPWLQSLPPPGGIQILQRAWRQPKDHGPAGAAECSHRCSDCRDSRQSRNPWTTRDQTRLPRRGRGGVRRLRIVRRRVLPHLGISASVRCRAGGLAVPSPISERTYGHDERTTRDLQRPGRLPLRLRHRLRTGPRGHSGVARTPPGPVQLRRIAAAAPPAFLPSAPGPAASPRRAHRPRGAGPHRTDRQTPQRRRLEHHGPRPLRRPHPRTTRRLPRPAFQQRRT